MSSRLLIVNDLEILDIDLKRANIKLMHGKFETTNHKWIILYTLGKTNQDILIELKTIIINNNISGYRVYDTDRDMTFQIISMMISNWYWITIKNRIWRKIIPK